MPAGWVRLAADDGTGKIVPYGDPSAAAGSPAASGMPITQVDTVSATSATPGAVALTGATINAANTGYSATAIQSAAAAAGSTFVIDCRGKATAEIVVLTNTLNNGLQLQSSPDGVNWFPVGGTPFVRQRDGAPLAKIPGADISSYDISVAGFEWIRVTTATGSTGAATVAGVGSQALGVVTVDNPAFAKASVATPASIAMTAASGTILAANPARLGATIFNDTAVVLSVAFGAVATVAAGGHTVNIAVGGYYEVPFGYTGIITGILAAGTGNISVSEFLA